jgi:hypothetical protein
VPIKQVQLVIRPSWLEIDGVAMYGAKRVQNVVTDRNSSWPFTFELVVRDKVLKLAAGSETERDLWLTAIFMMLDIPIRDLSFVPVKPGLI